MSLVVIDADVLGRQRTGDETHVRNLLRTLPEPAATAGFRLAAVTRRPDLVPPGVEAIELPARSQELRMAWSLPRLLRRLGADLVHTQYAAPLRSPCPLVVTIHDLSFESPGLMPLRDRLAFRAAVPRSTRAAARVLTVSERTKRDLVARYALAPEKVVVTPNGVDPVFSPTPPTRSNAAPAKSASNSLLQAEVRPGQEDVRSGDVPGSYVLVVGAVQTRKNQRAALAAAREVGLELVVVGPTKDEEVANELRRGGARLEGYVPDERLAQLYRGAACLVQPSLHEGFGLPVVEAMASGTPVVTLPDAALLEVVGNAAVVVEEADLADGIRRAVAERDGLVAAGLARAATFSWEKTARTTVRVYQEALGR